MKSLSLRSRAGSLVCPLCEVDKLNTHGHSSARCDSCGVLVSEATLEALNQITVVPDALGRHACEECGHPEMRLLPDGTHHCPACGSEVVPISAPSIASKPNEHSGAYWAGWVDGRFGERGSFVDNPNLAMWGNPSDRL